MSEIPKALICVGAPKCGTTWLYHQIKKSDNFNTPINKEVDFWNIYRHSSNVDRGGFKQLPRKVQKLIGLFFRANYFKNYKDDYDVDLFFLDFSPSYMDIKNKHIEQIKKNIGEVKFVLCTRNPAERVVSHLNYSVRMKKFFYLKLFLKDFYYKSRKCRRSTNYSGVYDRLVRAFGEDKVCVIAYEDLFSNAQKCEEKLSFFIGEKITLDTDEVLNKGESRVSVSNDMIKRINQYYYDQARFWEESLM
ncbi:sulfotransferase domain-containing protein [Aidingimonas halophila]|uniref:Sulfotransferase domain-containing protein n=1 Tax=Aidingimonas halophila TaxID=574349 RepID=A0A1H3CQS5_9GAMM|nr:sulfotransferase domain-containing protein [Aidingimonas halophila]GHC35069.1 hypothetical protein GCM10008094_30170 [Aidingimonas halophila]SDX56493.1 Sulfotransferase domain-containing protein [Aidingimonas halophila]